MTHDLLGWLYDFLLWAYQRNDISRLSLRIPFLLPNARPLHGNTAQIHPFLDPLELLRQHFVSWSPGASMISNRIAKEQARSLRVTGYRQLGGAKIKGD